MLTVLVAATAGIALLLLWPTGGEPDVSLLVETAPPARYRVVYAVTGPGLDTIVRDVSIERPYHARIVERQNGAVVGGALSNDSGAFQYVTADDRGWQLLQAGRFPATQDFRPVAVLRRAVEHEEAEVLGTDEVVGRRCTVVRTGAPLGGRVVAPSVDEHVELCIDSSSGIALSEVWTLGGEVARRTVARRIELDPAFDDATFAATPEVEGIPPGAGGSPIVTDLTAVERRQLPARIESLPDGFRFDGGSTQLRMVNGLVPESTVVERYRRGVDLLEVTYGSDAGEAPIGREIAAGPHRGHLDLHLTYATMTIRADDGRYVRIRGVDPEIVVEAAAQVRFDD